MANQDTPTRRSLILVGQLCNEPLQLDRAAPGEVQACGILCGPLREPAASTTLLLLGGLKRLKSVRHTAGAGVDGVPLEDFPLIDLGNALVRVEEVSAEPVLRLLEDDARVHSMLQGIDVARHGCPLDAAMHPDLWRTPALLQQHEIA